MKIKVLLVPTLIIAAGFVTLSYLKPGFDTYLEKKALLKVAEQNAQQAETIANNVGALKGEVETQKEKVTFVQKYLPAEKDQGRMFDGLNFLASQSGLLTSKIQVTEITEESEAAGQTFATLDPLTDADPLTVVDASDPNAVMMAPVVPPYQPPKVRNYGVVLEALGGYPNIKELLKRLTSFDRLQEVQNFKIEVTPATQGEDGEAVSGTLTLTYDTKLPYQGIPAPITGENIVTIPGLSQGSFNFGALDTIKTSATTVPDMVLGTDGKANPFE